MEDVDIRDTTIPLVATSNWFEATKSDPTGRTQTFTQTWNTQSSYRESRKNPNWRAQVKSGQNAATKFVAHRARLNIKPHNLHCTYSPLIYYYHPSERMLSGRFYTAGLGLPSVPSWMETEANNQAMTKYVSAANDARRIMQSGEMIGEFAELVRQVSSPGKSLRKGISAYVETVKKRTQRKSVLRLPKYRRSAEQAKLVRDSWLEYQFGWRPLVSEINSVIDYVNEEDPFSRYETRKVQGVGITEDAWLPIATHSTITQSPPAVTARKRAKVRVIVIYRGQLRTRPSAVGYIAEKVGMHPADWLPTVWELVPYSFLIDYFANIGDIISAFSLPSNALGWTVKTVIIEQTHEWVDQRINWYPDPGQSVTVLQADPGHASYTKRSVARDPFYGSLIPDFEFSIPNSGTRWLNMAALFIGSKRVEKLLQ